MKLDRSATPSGGGKYALVKMRFVRPDDVPVRNALALLRERGILDLGPVGSSAEFFVIRLRDVSSLPALEAYATHAESYDMEWANEIRGLASRAGNLSPWYKKPD